MEIFNSGVYIIRNLTNNHIYIGSSSNLSLREKHHFKHLYEGKHHSRYLQNAFNKYGRDEFEFSIILYCDNSNLLIYEQLYIDALNPEYNICKIAGSSLGVKRSKETIAKILGNKHCLGRVLSDRHRQIIRECNSKRVFSDTTKAKIGEASKRRGVSQQCHEARINKIKGVPLSEEHRKKIGEANKINHPRAWLGRTHTPEAKEKVRQAKLLYWENKRNSINSQTNP